MNSFINDLKNVIFSKIAIIFFSVANAILIARILGPENNGIIAAILVYPTIFTTLGSFGIRQSSTLLVSKNEFDIQQIKTASTHIWILSSILTLLVSFFLIKYFSNSNPGFHFIFLAITPIPFSLFNIYSSGIYLGRNEFNTFNKINWLPVVVIFLGTVGLVLIIPLGIEGVLIANILGPLLMFLIIIIKYGFGTSFNLNVDFKIIKSLLRLGIVYALSLIIINLNYKIDIILMDRLSNPFETGIYSKGASIIQYLWEIPMLLSTIIFARSANSSDGKGFSEKIVILMRVTFLIVLSLSIIIFVYADDIVATLFGSGFKNSASPLRILVPGILLLTLFQVMNMDLAGKGKPWVSMKAMIPALIINIILNYFFIPIWGADGAAFCSTISYSLAAILFLKAYAGELDIKIMEFINFSRADFLLVLNQIKLLGKY